MGRQAEQVGPQGFRVAKKAMLMLVPGNDIMLAHRLSKANRFLAVIILNMMLSCCANVVTIETKPELLKLQC